VAVPKDYPECAGGTCVLRLLRVLSDGTRLDCFANAAQCVGWWVDPDRDVNYECQYGSHVVPLLECAPYRPTFDVLTELDGGAKTETSPDTELGPDPAKYANPDGTLDNPSSTPPVDNPPGTCPPKAGFLAFLNPFWLFDTLKCAFVPSQEGLRAAWDEGDVDWCDTGPGTLICATGAVMAPLSEMGDDSTGCMGGPVTVPPIGMLSDQEEDITWYPFQACGELTGLVSTWWLGFASASIYLGAFLAGAAMLGKTIGAEQAVPS
jgi:hypothetical protein